MKKTNTHINDSCTRKAVVYCDNNGHYHLERYVFETGKRFVLVQYGKTKFKHIESANRAVQKWIKG